MDYANLAEWQVIWEMLHRNPADLTVLQIANKISLNEKTVYKWGQDPDNSGTVIPKKYEIPFSNITQDKRLFEWKSHQIGYRLKPMEKANISTESVFAQFLDAGQFMGHTMGEVKIALADGRIDDSEKIKIRSLLGILIRHCQGIQDTLNK